MKRESRRFKGGYSFRRFKGTLESKLEKAKRPEKVIIPLKQGFGKELQPNVSIGDDVVAGQVLARDDESLSTPIHATVSGKVEKFTPVTISGKRINSVVIKTGEPREPRIIEESSLEWQNLSRDKIEKLLYHCGVTSLGRSGIPTHFNTSVILPEDVEQIIIHSIEDDLYAPSPAVLLAGDRLSCFFQGIGILKKIMPEASVHICLNKKRKQLISLVEEELKKDRQCSVYGLKPVYPLSFEEVLIPTILGRDFPYGYNAANMGVLVLDVQAILHTYEAVALGKPLIERVVALGGTGFSRPTYITIRIGTSVGEVIAGRLVEGEKHRLLFDSINTGETIKDPAAPVNRTVSSIIAIPEGEKGEVLAFAQPGFNKDSVSNTFFSNILPVKKKIQYKFTRRKTGMHLMFFLY